MYCTRAANLGTVAYPYVIVLGLGLEYRDVRYTKIRKILKNPLSLK